MGVGLAVGGGVRGVAGGEGNGGADVLVLVVLPPLEVLKLPLPALALVLLPLLELDEPLLALAPALALALALALAPFEVCDITAGSRARATAATSRHSAAGDVIPATLPRQPQQLSFVYLRVFQVYPKEGDSWCNLGVCDETWGVWCHHAACTNVHAGCQFIFHLAHVLQRCTR